MKKILVLLFILFISSCRGDLFNTSTFGDNVDFEFKPTAWNYNTISIHQIDVTITHINPNIITIEISNNMTNDVITNINPNISIIVSNNSNNIYYYDKLDINYLDQLSYDNTVTDPLNSPNNINILYPGQTFITNVNINEWPYPSELATRFSIVSFHCEIRNNDFTVINICYNIFILMEDIMKKIMFVVFVVVVSIFMFGCSDVVGLTSYNVDPNLIGTWNYLGSEYCTFTSDSIILLNSEYQISTNNGIIYSMGQEIATYEFNNSDLTISWILLDIGNLMTLIMIPHMILMIKIIIIILYIVQIVMINFKVLMLMEHIIIVILLMVILMVLGILIMVIYT